MSSVEILDSVSQLAPERFLDALAASSDNAIIGKTLDGRIVFWNAAAERLYGYRADEILGREVSILVPPDRADEPAELLARVRTGASVRNLPTERVRKDGAIIRVSITVSPVLGAAGAVVGAATIAHDLTLQLDQLTELQQTNRRAAEAQATLDTLQASAPVGIGFVDREFRLVHLNEMLAGINGSTVEEQLGKTIAEVVPDVWPQVEVVYRRVLENDEVILNIEASGQTAADSGRTHYWLASYYPIHVGAEIIGVGVVVVDVTERRQAEEFRSIAMNQMAEGLFVTDDQGQITFMNQAVTRMLGWTESDLEGKRVHDLIHTQRPDGTAILSESDCDQPKGIPGQDVRGDDEVFTCKDGSLLAVAYSAMPISAGAGFGTVVVFRDITEERSERHRVRRELAALTWVGRIREALDEDRFILYSQPIEPLAGGQPSEELLIRMTGRNGNVVLPGAFLGVAETYGLIGEIDQWVVKQAAGLAASGRHVGVNLSAESIGTLDLLSLIEAAIYEAGANPSNLMFEITETTLMRDINKGETFARGIADLGCRLALDDFGTGFGTFMHLKRLPINYLKIDIEFVRDLVSTSANQHVVKAIVNLAQGFGCETIAEGVEDGDTLNLLRDFGVDYAQGYYLGRPAPLYIGQPSRLRS